MNEIFTECTYRLLPGIFPSWIPHYLPCTSSQRLEFHCHLCHSRPHGVRHRTARYPAGLQDVRGLVEFRNLELQHGQENNKIK